jgi:hypothetical protein
MLGRAWACWGLLGSLIAPIGASCAPLEFHYRRLKPSRFT